MLERSHLYWIGVRESEIMCTGDLFVGSISVFGSNIYHNASFEKEYSWRFDCNIDHSEWIDYINDKVERIIERDPKCQFMLYYPADYPHYTERVRERVKYLNDMDLITLLENKIQSKLWFGDYVPLLPYSLEVGRDIRFRKLQSKFEGAEKFVIQSTSSCGGSGTWLFSAQTADTIHEFIEEGRRYLVTPYIEKSVSVNIHAVIYAEEIVLLPPSVQIISTENNSFSYRGGDFIAYQKLPQNLREKLTERAYTLGNLLRDKGYRGICGIDFLAQGADLYFMEVNSRFQASTFLINRALETSGVPNSVQNLHKDAFENPKCSYKIPSFDVPYSFYCYSYHQVDFDRVRQLYDIQKEFCCQVECVDNYLDWNTKKDENTYLYEFVLEQSITALAPDFSCRIDPNIDINSGIISSEHWERQLLELKIMLLNHGTRITPNALKSMASNGGVNFQEFYAVDLMLCGLYINVPFNLGLTALSPFLIDTDHHGHYILKYWGREISRVTLRYIDPLGLRHINGHQYNEISYLGVDRLRIYHRTGCFYKDLGLGCKFCDVEPQEHPITVSEVKKVLDAYMDHPAVRHYLIGGGSDAPNSDFQTILEIAKYIRNCTDKSIYLMCLPPADVSILKELRHAGITEVTFNLEIFDRELAKSLMPGKGRLPISVYDAAFKEAVALWGRNCKVRSAFVVGLEPAETLFKGIEHICRFGVSPILSLFKPIPGTPLEYMLPPSNKEIAEICREIYRICKTYGVELGPSCRYCEDNTLKISAENLELDLR